MGLSAPHEQSPWSLPPHPGVRTSLAPSSPHGLVHTRSIILGQRVSHLIPTSRSLHAHRPCNYWGSRRPLHRHKPAEPPLHKKEDTEKAGRLSGYWIGSSARHTRREGRLWILKRQGGLYWGFAALWRRRGDATKDENSKSNASLHSAHATSEA